MLFVAASFYLNMFYFLTLLVTHQPGCCRSPETGDRKVPCLAPDNGISSGTRQFTRIFINTFFMNTRTLTLAIGLIFSVDIVFTLIAFSAGLPLDIAIFVISQSAVIILFYYLVSRIEPFTAEFARNIDRVRDRLPASSRVADLAPVHDGISGRCIRLPHHDHPPAGRHPERISLRVRAHPASRTCSCRWVSLPPASISSSGTCMASPAGRWQSA